MRFAFVVPRYGDDVVGGAETLARGLAEHLSKETYNVEILTTCARSHFTWENYYTEGVNEFNGIKVRYFRVNGRDIGAFLNIQRKIEQGILPEIEEQLIWARESVNSDGLYDYIWRNGRDYDYFFFLPYLFGTTFWGSQIYPEKSVLIPCLHDEVYARLDIFRMTFEKVMGVIFNSNPERLLAERLFSIKDKPSAVVGMGFEAGHNGGYDPDRFRKRFRIEGDYIIYFGRKEGGKNLPLLLDYFSRFKREGKGRLKLVLAGDGEVRVPQDMKGEIVDLGFLSEGEKMDALSGAILLCQPSMNESFSIVIMESWLAGKPVLVHGDCEVTREHVKESGGGLYFKNYYEFAEILRYLSDNKGQREALGRKGKEYVLDKYSWPAVIRRFDNAMKVFGK